MRTLIIPVTAFQQNCSLLICEATLRAAVVDPGGEVDLILAHAERAGVTLERILLTHGHIDHAGGVADLAERLDLPIEGPHPADRFWIDALPQQSRMFGLPDARAFSPDRWLHDGDSVRFGDETLAVLHCPGHTPGHVVFYHEATRLAWVGDVLFKGSIGRTDFPQGNHADLIHSIQTKLWPLGDDVRFIPGHGPSSSIGEERRGNPFVQDRQGKRSAQA
ncbi:MAG: MBL fold metallo-hydrolase [Thiotrichales bacterium]